nr:UBP1-associated proteins 1C-like isoform X4 [Ipomoea batatas]GME08200.1 UBP1-associated proteins 1C-like isoform X4 [Ipomoea batatas]
MSGQLKTSSYIRMSEWSREEISQMGLLKFGLLCIDFFAWPMLALAYPLCVSIRAIETGSKYHMRKLVTYWTVLSIVSLFEHTLRVMEWVPLWPYLKLVGTFWLVVPRFNGACYAYDCLVNADLGAKLHCILSQINHAFLAHKHLLNSPENGCCCRLMQSIDIKGMEQKTEQGTEETKSRVVQSKEFKAMEQTTEQGITEERKVKSAIDSIGQMQKQETEAPWVKGTPEANAAEEKIIPEINSSKLIQREWTCAVCQVTTTSEINLKSHLGGKMHRTNCAELKPIKWVTKDPGSSSPKATDLPNQVKNEPTKHALAVGGSKQETDVKPEKATSLPNRVTNESAKHAPIEGEWKLKTSGKQEKFQANASGKEESTDSKPYCSVCNIWISREADVVSHLKGRKHLSKLKQMGILMANEPAKPEKETGLQNQVKIEPAKPNALAEEGSMQKTDASVITDSKLYCSFCNICLPCEAALVVHLKGRKHLSKLKQMGILMANEPAKPEKETGLQIQVENEPAKPNSPAEEGSKQKTNASVSTDAKPYCSFCNIWPPSEADSVAHLKGRKHLSKLKQMGIFVANEPANHTPAGGGSKQETDVKPEKATGLENQVENEPAKPNAPAEGGSKQKIDASVSTDSKPYCSFCNIWPPCEAALVAHLKGRKHLSKLKQMGILMGNEPAKPEKETDLQNQVENEPAKPNTPAEEGSKQNTNASVITDSKPYCSFCNIWPPCEAALVAHLKGRKHLSKLKQMGILMV